MTRKIDGSPVAFVDSGVGGLPYLDWVRERRPFDRFVYIADRENFPYGKRRVQELISIVSGVVARAIACMAPRLIVIACNTASVAALAALRAEFSVPFVGVVPAVKPAAAVSVRRSIGLLATPGTVADVYTDQLVQEFASDCRVERIGDAGIVDFVERRLIHATKDERMASVRSAARAFRRANIDALVVGCTHFVHVLPELHASLGRTVRIVDSREGVGRQVQRILGNDEGAAALSHAARDGFGELYVTDAPRPADPYAVYAQRYGLVFRGQLPECSRMRGS